MKLGRLIKNEKTVVSLHKEEAFETAVVKLVKSVCGLKLVTLI